MGGNLSPGMLLSAYRQGIFPWFSSGEPLLWWSPDPRGHCTPEHLHVSRRLARTIRTGGYHLTWNRCFGRVMRACGDRDGGGTWIIPEMVAAYTELHRRGHAHSLEVWCDDELVGGVYGVQVGGLFSAESKFHRRRDMSKVALVALVRSLFRAGVRLLDVQFVTDHLATLGARQISRREYLRELGVVCELPVDLSNLEPAP